MCCQTCINRDSCGDVKSPCYVPSEPNILIKPYGLIEPNYPYPNYYTTSTPVIPYYWGRIVPVSEDETVIIH